MSSPRAHSGPGAASAGPPSGVEPITGPYRAGEVIDEKYILIRKIGEGGMGAVWIAHNSVLDVHCALKLIDVGKTTRQMADRLLDEARAAARIVHPSIVRVLDYGETPRGDPFIAMELLDGEDIAQLMDRVGRVDAVAAVQMLLPIVHALGTAHSKGIVHRDVKPENIFLAKDEVTGTMPKLLDFGIVRLENNNRRLTMAGAVLGTPDYMSPEQAKGQDITGQSDLWSFCIVLYELIAGKRPFDGDNYNALMRAIIEDEPQTLEELGLADTDLSSIVWRGMRKPEEERWPTMRELGEELALWLESHGVNEDITGGSLRRTWLAATESKRIELPPNLRERSLSTQSGMNLPPRSNPTLGEVTPALAMEQNLAAIADLHGAGDPEELLRRDARRRNVALVIGLVVVVAAAVFAVLFGTGIVGGEQP